MRFPGRGEGSGLWTLDEKGPFSVRDETFIAFSPQFTRKDRGRGQADPLNLTSLSVPSSPYLFCPPPLREKLLKVGINPGELYHLFSSSPLSSPHHVMPMAVNEREGGAKTALRSSAISKVGDFSPFCVDAAAASLFSSLPPSHRI